MKNRLTLTLASIGAVLIAGEALAKEAMNPAYVQSGCDGIFYARCIPAEASGESGVTDVYRVWKDGDERVDHYEWYAKRGVVLGWSPIAGKVAMLALREQHADSLAQQAELSFYLGGKHLRTWTTVELQELGAEVAASKTDDPRKRAMFRVLGCEQIPNTNEYVFTIQFPKGKKVSFDILSGEIYRK